ncbi:MAG: peptidylprolyl isomerase [Actinomycetota bacterium]|nr:peptidylprolyl isomerase [Actinomycetota bacterium]
MSRIPPPLRGPRARRALPALAAGLAVLVLSGCAGPVRAGAAAVVGDDTVSTERLRGVVERGLADPQAAQQLGADRPAFQRQVLSRMISAELVEVAARERQVTVSEGEVDARTAELVESVGGQEQLEQQARASGVGVQDLRPLLRDVTLNDKLADALVEDEQVPPQTLRTLYQQNIAQFDQVRARHVLLRTQAEAQQVLAQVRRDPASFARLAQERSLDEGSKANGGELPPAGRGTYVREFENALFSARPGQAGVVRTEFGFHVYELLERRTTTLEQATPVLRRQALQEQRAAALGTTLQQTADELGVRVNPRFGRWDDQQLQVVERESTLSTPAPQGGADGSGELPGGLEPEQGVEQPPEETGEETGEEVEQPPAEEPAPAPTQ